MNKIRCALIGPGNIGTDLLYKLRRSNPAKKVKLFADPFRDPHSQREDLPEWKGTVVGIDLTLDATEEFTTLLDSIRDVYVRSIKERKRAEIRRPRFI